MSYQHPQLPLTFSLNESYRLDNFLVGENGLLLAELAELLAASGENYLYLWGESGVGCSHLLQAVCNNAVEQGGSAMYLPLAEIMDYGVAVLENLEALELVCLDNLEAIAGNPEWEEALFHLFNRIKLAEHKLIVAAHNPPAHVGVQLPDLVSRLGSGAVYQVQPLDDDNLMQLLQQRAALKGLELPEEVAHFIINRSGRDNATLCQLIEQLDTQSMAAQRKLTIPFVKEVLDW